MAGYSAPFRGLLFDLDGTLVDTTELICQSFRHAAGKVMETVPADEVLMANVGQPLMKQMRLLDAAHAQELYDTYREFNHARHDEFIQPYPGITEMLEELKKRDCRMGIVTSKSRDTTDMAFDVIPIEKYFDTVVTADMTENHKPDPHPLQLAMRNLDVTPDESVYIGDSPFDIRAGHAAGTKTAAVAWGMFPEVRLKELEPDYFFRRPEEILFLCGGPGA